MKKYRGVLHFHSETGTEGGYWALQDENFMNIPDDTEKCEICGIYRSYYEEHGNPELTDEMLQFGFRVPCEGEHCWQKAFPNGKWSYEGLHILKDKDWLVILDKDNASKIVWEGRIELFQQPLFEEEVFGFWIHSDQRGVNREQWATWFFEGYPALLMTSG